MPKYPFNHSCCNESKLTTEPIPVCETTEGEGGLGHYDQYCPAMSWEADLLGAVSMGGSGNHSEYLNLVHRSGHFAE